MMKNPKIIATIMCIVIALSIGVSGCINKNPQEPATPPAVTDPTNPPATGGDKVDDPSPEVKPEVKPEEKPDATSKDLQKIIDDILAKYETPAGIAFDKDTFASVYGVDKALVKNIAGFMPMMNVKVNEIVIAEAASADDVAVIKKAFEARQAQVVKTFEQYLQDQLEVAKGAIIATNGNYVYMIMDQNASDIEAIITAGLK